MWKYVQKINDSPTWEYAVVAVPAEVADRWVASGSYRYASQERWEEDGCLYGNYAI